VKIEFYKYHGTGNDFIIIDNRFIHWQPLPRQVSKMCDRHFGIGSDGLILLSEKKGFDFAMTYFNSDGNESTMCGNGGRCITAFAKLLGIINEQAHFIAIDGEHEAFITGEDMTEVHVSLKIRDVVVDKPECGYFFIDTGSPHTIIFSSNVKSMDIIKRARKIRYDTCFAEEGTNVNFVEIHDDHLFVRSYERGVEDETLSCGTGIAASALAAAMKNPGNSEFYNIKTRGGELKVRFKQKDHFFTDIWLEGPAELVFRGVIEVRG